MSIPKGSVMCVRPDGRRYFSGETILKKQLIVRAVELGRDPSARAGINVFMHELLVVTNSACVDRCRFIGIGRMSKSPFPEADKMRVRLTEFLRSYWERQSVIDEGIWEREVVPQIQLLAKSV